MKKSPIEITPDEMHSKVESWNLPEDKEVREYSSNQLIHAYTTGITEGMEKDEKLFYNQIKQITSLAGKDTALVVDYLKKQGINPRSAHLRIESKYSVDVLITISDEDFVKDSFISVYSFVKEIQDKTKSDLYEATFNFINRSNQFDLDAVKADGFLSSFIALEETK